MKKVLLLIFLLLLSGCTKYKTMTCIYTNEELKEGTIKVNVVYDISSFGNIKKYTKIETMRFKDSYEREVFYRQIIENLEKVGETDLEYTTTVNYKDKLSYESVKQAMEGQKYKCELSE